MCAKDGMLCAVLKPIFTPESFFIPALDLFWVKSPENSRQASLKDQTNATAMTGLMTPITINQTPVAMLRCSNARDIAGGKQFQLIQKMMVS